MSTLQDDTNHTITQQILKKKSLMFLMNQKIRKKTVYTYHAHYIKEDYFPTSKNQRFYQHFKFCLKNNERETRFEIRND